jgi:hypothetical protein
MNESQKEELLQTFLKQQFKKNLNDVTKAESQVVIEKITTPNFKEKTENLKVAHLLLNSTVDFEHDLSYIFLEASIDGIVKKDAPNRDTAIYQNLSKIDSDISSTLALRLNASNEMIFNLPSRIVKKYPDEISDELFWILDRGFIYLIKYNNINFYLIIKEESYNRILFESLSEIIEKKINLDEKNKLSSTKVNISNATEFILGRYFLPFFGKVNQYEIGIKFLELIYFSSLNIKQKVGICFKQTLKIESSTFTNYFFIHLNTPAEVKSYSHSLFEIFTQLSNENINFLKSKLKINNISQDILEEIDFNTLNGKKFYLLKTDLRITKNHLTHFLIVDPNYLNFISQKVNSSIENTRLKTSSSILEIAYSINSTVLHKDLDKYADYSYALPDDSVPTKDNVKKFLLLARFFNLIDTRDLMVLIQNYFVQNYKTADLINLFYYSVINPTTNIRKNTSLIEFDEKRFTRFLVGVHVEEFEFLKTKELKGLDFLYDHNMKLFLELNLALKSDKIILSEKGRYVFYNVFMNYYKESREADLNTLGTLNDYITNVKAFPKKFASEMINELSKEVICISYIENREALDFLITFMSKNRKDQMTEDFIYFKKQYKEKRIDILDVYESRKVLFQKYNELKEALKDEGMI